MKKRNLKEGRIVNVFGTAGCFALLLWACFACTPPKAGPVGAGPFAPAEKSVGRQLLDAKLLIIGGQAEAALKRLDGLQTNQPAARRARQIIRALALERLDDLTRFKQILDAILQANPDDARVLFLLGKAEIQNGDLDRGLTFLNRARQLRPENPEVLFELYDNYRQLGHLDKAEAFLIDLVAADDAMGTWSRQVPRP